MPILAQSASDVTATVKASAQVNAAVGGASSKGGNSAPPPAGGAAAGRAVVTQNKAAQTSTIATIFRIPPVVRAVPWTPGLLSATRLWLDGSDPLGTGVVPANDTVITSWKDKSGNNRHATAFNSPLLKRSIQNNLAGVFTQQATPTSYFSVDAPAGFFNTALHFVCVYMPITAAVTSYNTTLNRGATLNQYWNQRYIRGGTAYTNTWNIGDNENTARIHENLIATAPASSTYTYREFVDGTELTGLYGYTTGFPHQDNSQTKIDIGHRAGELYMTGYFLEILAFNTALPTSVRQQLQGYLAWKWGLVSKLPVSHPYKAFSPVF